MSIGMLDMGVAVERALDLGCPMFRGLAVVGSSGAEEGLEEFGAFGGEDA
jgi:hypothetical protein